MNGLAHPERVALARLRALLELLPNALDKELAAIGLTSFEYVLLEALAEAAEGRMRLSALAARTNATLPRLSRVASGLERKGLIVRAACELDGRATNAVLTDLGRQRYAEAAPRYAEAVRRLILDGLADGGVEQLAGLSLAILARLDPEGRLEVTAGPVAAESSTDADAAVPCSADPRPCRADPEPSVQAVAER
ncbi:MarR family winged helix-turn-helix transcriptional regulator [Naumannella halotolerans]|uniref:DNA-binding MarR family transcriptional regulator n=1 Tax=Naumannella halotolerans TaxID=993414 RepID=A0A4R7JAA3_9ACTN|nr:MarR family transcriptional regulator [Naumannella halotolerans]TDT33547.1 DNA-binding MarR family transcriptional regulator [Naumannella halotolerans]